MNFGEPSFVLTIIMICTAGWIANNWIRAKHGYALEDEWGGKTERKDTEEATKLRETNAKLLAMIEKQDKRMAALETIVTDKGYRLNEEIEALRDQNSSDNGVELKIASKELER